MSEPVLSTPVISEQIIRGNTDSVMTILALKIMISEVASLNRTPQQADAFVSAVRKKMEEFIISSNKELSGEIGNIIKDEMDSYINKLLGGIKFERTEK